MSFGSIFVSANKINQIVVRALVNANKKIIEGRKITGGKGRRVVEVGTDHNHRLVAVNWSKCLCHQTTVRFVWGEAREHRGSGRCPPQLVVQKSRHIKTTFVCTRIVVDDRVSIWRSDGFLELNQVGEVNVVVRKELGELVLDSFWAILRSLCETLVVRIPLK